MSEVTSDSYTPRVSSIYKEINQKKSGGTETFQGPHETKQQQKSRMKSNSNTVTEEEAVMG